MAEITRDAVIEQESLYQFGRATGAVHHHDEMTYRQTGKWGTQLPEDWYQRLYDTDIDGSRGGQLTTRSG